MRVAILAVVCMLVFASAMRSEFSVWIDDQNTILRTLQSIDKTATAWGSFIDSTEQNGWGILNVKANSAVLDDTQAFAVGYVEGALTQSRFESHYQNYLYTYKSNFPDNEIAPEVYNFIDQNISWVESKIENAKTPFWLAVRMVYNQLLGFTTAYADFHSEHSPSLAFRDMWLYNAEGDSYEIIPAVLPKKAAAFDYSPGSDDVINRMHFETSCSAYAAFSADRTDLFFAHATWTHFNEMDRIYKNIEIPSALSTREGRHLKVSYPSKYGYMFSKDDFYFERHRNLLVWETTNSPLNQDVYAAVTPKSLLTWMRAPVAFTLSDSAEEWGINFLSYHSGTYGNQWAILDLKRVHQQARNEPMTLENGAFFVLEETPGQCTMLEQTDRLRKDGFWASYNVPYYPQMRRYMGYESQERLLREQANAETDPKKRMELLDKAQGFNHSQCPRARIFHRELTGRSVDGFNDGPPQLLTKGGLHTLEDAKKLIRMNKYETDPVSNGDPSRAIASRYDLRADSPAAFGGIDAKVTSVSAAKKQNGPWIESGPTHDDQTPFDWLGPNYYNDPHVAQPDLWNFGFVEAKLDETVFS